MGLYRKKNNTEVSQIAGNVDYSEINELKQNFNKLSNYISGEQEIGTYNGETLYRAILTSNGSNIDASQLNIKDILSMQATAKDPSYRNDGKTYIKQVDFWHKEGRSYDFSIVYNTSDKIFEFEGGISAYNRRLTIKVVIEYIKN